MAVRSSSSSVDWNSSSRGSVSRMWRSALPLWLARAQARLAHHVFVALAHQRDVPRAAVVGAGGVQAEEALFAHRLALGVERQHADVIHVARAVHGGARVGLGQDQRVDRTRLRHVVRRAATSADAACPRRAPRSRPRPRVRMRDAACLPCPASRRFVFAIAQEGEVVVGGPAQEFLRLGAARIVTPACCARPALRRRRASRRASASQSAHAGAHVGEHACARACSIFAIASARLAVDLEVDAAIRACPRRRRPACRPCRASSGTTGWPSTCTPMPMLGQRHRHRVDQERHVVVERSAARCAAIPSRVPSMVGVEQAHVGLARLARARRSRGCRAASAAQPSAPCCGVFVVAHALVEACARRPRLRRGAPSARACAGARMGRANAGGAGFEARRGDVGAAWRAVRRRSCAERTVLWRRLGHSERP